MTSPEIFGPKLWYLLHTSAASYPEKPDAYTTREMTFMIIGLPALVPCSICKSHVRSWLQYNQLRIKNAVKSRETLFSLFVDLHNSVNRRLNKRVWSLQDAKNQYY
jgi:FAD-linked sulfhydryl oxidase